MTAEMKVSAQSLEQFLALAKTGQGATLVPLIHQLLEVPGVYVFGEVLELPNVQELMRGPFSQTYQLLSLFTYGTFSDYIANASNLPALTPAQKIKLRHLSIVSMAAKVKCIPYSVLLLELHMTNLREVEDLIIEAIYADIVQGKLDQCNQLLEVDFSIGRDIRQQDISAMSRTLQAWCNSCELVLVGIEDQIHRADHYKDHQLKVQQQLDTEVSNLKKTLRATTGGSVQDSEQHLLEPRDPVTPQDQRQGNKKPSKGKGLRGSAKIWSKSN